jgi:hypothetical protein
MVEQGARCGRGARIAGLIRSALLSAIFLSAAPICLADELVPLTVERPPKQTMVLTQGYSTTLHSERPFGKIAITDPDIVDLVLRTDKSAVLLPVRLGRTNVDFLDDHGNLIERLDVEVIRQSVSDRVMIYDRPSLGAYSAFHCGPNGCERFEEVPAREQALTPNVPGMPPQ